MAATILPSSPALGDAFFIGLVDVVPFPHHMGGFETTSTGTHDGFALMTGNAAASETDTIQMGAISGSSGQPFGIAAAFATGTQTVTVTNENPVAGTIDIAFHLFAFLATGVGSANDSARASFTLTGSGPDFHFEDVGPRFVQGNDPPVVRIVDNVLGQSRFAAGESKSFTFTYTLTGLAQTAVPEPSSMILCVTGIVGMFGYVSLARFGGAMSRRTGRRVGQS